MFCEEFVMLKSSTEVLGNLCELGYEVTYDYLNYLVRQRLFVPPATLIAGRRVWNENDEERLKDLLQRRGRGPTKTVGAT